MRMNPVRMPYLTSISVPLLVSCENTLSFCANGGARDGLVLYPDSKKKEDAGG